MEYKKYEYLDPLQILHNYVIAQTVYRFQCVLQTQSVVSASQPSYNTNDQHTIASDKETEVFDSMIHGLRHGSREQFATFFIQSGSQSTRTRRASTQYSVRRAPSYVIKSHYL